MHGGRIKGQYFNWKCIPVGRVRPSAGVRTVRILPASKTIVIYRAEPVNPAETARVAAYQPNLGSIHQKLLRK